ncbi:MAG: GNAT family N-acetyltransferase [Clostridia bacterium]|nr:GNAT family N-acetyltransferase [Clostridia bacterium]
MKKENVIVVPLAQEDREQFILDNQWAFKHGAMVEFGERDNHIDGDGEIISRKTIERCINDPNNETYRIVVNGKNVGGVILKIDNETHINELEILFVLPEEHSKGIGYGAWKAVEELHPETVIWKTCTPYFDKRNIHFYVNKCGFHIDEFWCEYFVPDHPMPDDGEEYDPDEGPDEMFHFIKRMK